MTVPRPPRGTRLALTVSLVAVLSVPSLAVRAPHKSRTTQGASVTLDELPVAPQGRESRSDRLVASSAARAQARSAARRLAVPSLDPHAALAAEALAYLQDQPSALQLASTPPLRLDYVRTVPGRAGVKDRVYVRFVQTVDNIDIDGSEVSFSLDPSASLLRLIGLRARLYPDLKTLPTAIPATAAAEAQVARRAGHPRLKGLGVRVRYVQGQWRTLREFHVIGPGYRGAADASGKTFLWDERLYATEGRVAGVGIRFDPGATGANLEAMPLPHLLVNAPSNVQTDAVGAWRSPTSIAPPSRLVGTNIEIFNDAPGGDRAPQQMTDGAVAETLFNAPTTDEFETARVNAYVHTNRLRDWLLSRGIAPAALTNDTLPVTVNLNDYCNAYFSLDGLHFFKANSECRNTAYDTIIYHEYGHFVDWAIGGITDGGLSEGWGDVLATFYSEQPIIGESFGYDGSIVRSAENHYRFYLYDEVHSAGQAWAGFAWDLRKQLGKELAEALILPVLWANSPNIPAAVKEVLYLDDDDGNLANGTPHFEAIRAAAAAHGLEFALTDFSAPVITLKEPLNGSSATYLLRVVFTASDNGTLDRWAIHYGSRTLASKLLSPTPLINVQTMIDVSSLPEGPQELVVKAVDTLGNQTEVAFTVNVHNPPQSGIGIDAGGPGYVALDGTFYKPDYGYEGGYDDEGLYNFSNTDDDALYNTARKSSSLYFDEPFSYAIPVANGLYEVTLKMAPIGYYIGGYFPSFHYTFEGTDRHDIWLRGSGPFDIAPYSVTDVKHLVRVNDGVMNIQFQAATASDRAMVNGILLQPTAVPVPVITSPSNGATVSPGTVVMTWTTNDDVRLFDVRVQDLQSTTPLDARNTPGCPHTVCINGYSQRTLSFEALPGHQYVMWVHSIYQNEGSAASDHVLVTASGGYGTPPWPLPGRVEAEDFNSGGEGVGYHDVESMNQGVLLGSKRRTGEGVDVVGPYGDNTGAIVGWTRQGEWMDYNVAAAAAGTYVMRLRLAYPGDGAVLSLTSDGRSVAPPINVPNTGAWDAWRLVSIPVSLAAGPQRLRLAVQQEGASGFAGNIDWMEFVGPLEPTGVTVELVSGYAVFRWTPQPDTTFHLRAADLTDPAYNTDFRLSDNDCPGNPPHYLCRDSGVLNGRHAINIVSGHRYRYWMHAVQDGVWSQSVSLDFTATPTGLMLQDGGTINVEPAQATASMAAARVYPNPWRATGSATAITFDRLPPGTTIKLFTIAAHHIATLHADGAGAAVWPLKDDDGHTVASGVYIYLFDDGQGHRRRGLLSVIR